MCDERCNHGPKQRKPGDLLFDDTTVMVTDETSGAQKGTKICRYDLIPAEALAEYAALLGKGAEKYSERNWEKGGRFSLNFGAMMRHAWRFWRGEDFDPETGMHHLSCVVFHAFAIMTYQARDIGTDDRTT
jgi:hypothetical protein